MTGFFLARQVGIEPTTIRLTVGRSTAELLPNTALGSANGSLAWVFGVDKCGFGARRFICGRLNSSLFCFVVSNRAVVRACQVCPSAGFGLRLEIRPSRGCR
jgi:hypothetical protein